MHLRNDLYSVWRKCCDWSDVSKWSVKFHAGDFLLDDAQWLGRTVEVDSDQIKTDNHQCYTMWERADILTISRSSAESHLYQLGYVHFFEVWVPHKWKNLLDCISSCNCVEKCSENIPVLKQIVTSNEKWILYNNVEWKRSWGKWNETPPTTSKANLHPKKVMYLWCDWKGVLYYELFLENQTINSNKYCSQINWRQCLTQSVQNYLTENA